MGKNIKTKKSRHEKVKKVVKNKKSKFSFTDYIAVSIFAIIIAVIVGSIGYYYAIYLPHSRSTVSERAKEFTELYFTVDYLDEDFSFEPLYEYLTVERRRILQQDQNRILNNRKIQELQMEIHQIETETLEISWDSAKVKVIFQYTERKIDQEPETNWGIVYYHFRKVGDQWLIERYYPGEKEEIDNINAQR
ncbi:hypothetical protein [Anaerobranca gottschalkii]|uniref:SnoaL-like domain-containing protein n=1 Tax=Anaerobranca gottschalkii DSM 13577 TaxID=1120990 RepID=A0A1I0BHX3_9FIRM|nr:hypothetical protein [Anaerobranca gottschalkii]SET06596.1 hypothetical protein SAMN03080614_104022 [Anaerobranca gottschalkii DSM 13577]